MAGLDSMKAFVGRSSRAAPHQKGMTPQGWRVPGGGYAPVLDGSAYWEGTSNQVCGLWPFIAGSTHPAIGVPLGHHLASRGYVCGDPVTWFRRGLINNPSAFVLGRPGLGKSSLIRHMLLVLAAWGVNPMILSDIKPDYVDLVEALDGDVVRLGRGLSSVNPLDPGPIADVIPQLSRTAAEEVTAQFHGRRVNTLVGLCELVRGSQVADFEATVLSEALRLCDPTMAAPPVIPEVLAMIQRRPAPLRDITRTGASEQRFDDRVDRLLDALLALGPQGAFGTALSRHTTYPVRAGHPTVFDMSAVDETDVTLQGALQLTCWAHGSAIVQANKVAAAQGLAPERPTVLVMDELWKILRASELMVDRIDALTRLNRQLLLPQIMCTHTMLDLQVGTDRTAAMAAGFVERSEMVFLGGLAPREMGSLSTVFAMSDKEQDMVTGWGAVQALSSADQRGTPPGQGLFLLKVGARPGVPFKVALTSHELRSGLHDTNKRWGAYEQSVQQAGVPV